MQYATQPEKSKARPCEVAGPADGTIKPTPISLMAAILTDCTPFRNVEQAAAENEGWVPLTVLERELARPRDSLRYRLRAFPAKLVIGTGGRALRMYWLPDVKAALFPSEGGRP